jgi:hypothetical protein
MCVGIEGLQGRGARRERGSCKSAQTHCQIGVTAMTTQTQCAYLHMVPPSC